MRAITALLIKKGPMNKNSSIHRTSVNQYEESWIHVPTISLSNNNTILVSIADNNADTKMNERLYRFLKRELLTSKLISNQIIMGTKYIYRF